MIFLNQRWTAYVILVKSPFAGGHKAGPHDAQVAQSVEQRIENPRVGGSIPPLGTTFLTKNISHTLLPMYSHTPTW